MNQREKLIDKILSGTSDNNLNFNDLRTLLESFNIKLRIKGDRYIHYKEGIEEIINIQPLSNSKQNHIIT